MFCPDEWMTDFTLGNVRKTKIDESGTGKKLLSSEKSFTHVSYFQHAEDVVL